MISGIRKWMLVLLCLFFHQVFSSSYELEALSKSFIESERVLQEPQRKLVLQQTLEKGLSFAESHPQELYSYFWYNMGNVYFHLKDYPTAILSYYKALKMSPREQKLWHNLSVAHQKLELPFSNDLWDAYLPSYQELLAFALLTTSLTFLSYLGALFWPITGLKKGKKVLILLTTVIFVVLIQQNFFPKIEAIVLEDSPLYHDKGKIFLRNDAPLLKKGQKIVILSIEQDNKWASVKSPHQKQGYYPLEKLGII